MPANYIVINSKFKPFSYAEMLQPVQMSTEAHQDIENAYADLSAKANIWDELANEQTDPYAYNLYKSYSDDLEKQAGQLAREGLSPISRQNILNMRQRYSKDIIPIEQAYQRRNELINEQREALLRDNTMMFNTDASMLSLDDLIRNPSLSYQMQSGEALAKQAGEAAKNLSQVIRDDPRKWSNILGGQYFESIVRSGYSPQEIVDVLQKSPNGQAILKQILDDVIGSSQIPNWNNQELIDRAYNYAGRGLWEAIGKTDYQTLNNKYYDYAMRDYLSRRGSGKEDTPKERSLLIAPRAVLGATGEMPKEQLETLRGLRPTTTGYTTDRLDSAQRELDMALEQYHSVVNNPSFDMSKIHAYIQSPGRLSRSIDGVDIQTSPDGLPLGYSQYIKASRNLDKAREKLVEERRNLTELEEKYRFLGGTPYENISIGLQLDQTQAKQDNSFFPLNIDETQYKKVRAGIKNVLKSASREDIKKKGFGLVNDRGKFLSYKQLDDIDFNEVQIRVLDKGGDPKLELVYEGEPYTLYGLENVDKFNQEISKTNEYLGDFSNNIARNLSPISHQQYQAIMSGADVRDMSNVSIFPIEGFPNHQGAALYDATSGNIVKILMDSSGRVLAVNTLQDELNGGERRDEYIRTMGSTALYDLLELFAAESE